MADIWPLADHVHGTLVTPDLAMDAAVCLARVIEVIEAVLRHADLGRDVDLLEHGKTAVTDHPGHRTKPTVANALVVT